jgi:membrane-associated protease RseP (regulator of RpoE activity)
MADDGFDSEQPEVKRGFAAVRTNVYLFVATVVSVFLAGAVYERARHNPEPMTFTSQLEALVNPRFLLTGWMFAVPLLVILLTHEFGHYFAAKYHRVPASLPYFIPLPFVGMFGTLGAVIGMSGRIRSRAALLDIGAAGPLAGLVVALPVLGWGIAASPVKVLPEGAFYEQEGQSILYSLVKRIVHGPIPDGSDVLLHPTALAGWAGLLVTMLNLIPFGQLDGGHIAYALFGKKQDRFALWVRRGLLALVAYNLIVFFGPILMKTSDLPWWAALGNSMTWLIWYGLLGLLARVSGRDHPPFEPGPISRGRRFVAWLCLTLFVVLFMPTPFAVME